ncbi:MAG: hypothetical protein ABSA31_05685 [Acidimicrobiales bacterium]
MVSSPGQLRVGEGDPEGIDPHATELRARVARSMTVPVPVHWSVATAPAPRG